MCDIDQEASKAPLHSCRSSKSKLLIMTCCSLWAATCFFFKTKNSLLCHATFLILSYLVKEIDFILYTLRNWESLPYNCVCIFIMIPNKLISTTISSRQILFWINTVLNWTIGRGQGYDNGANVNEKKRWGPINSLHLNPLAINVLFDCHSYNLVLCDAAKSSVKSVVVFFFGYFRGLFILFSASVYQ